MTPSASCVFARFRTVQARLLQASEQDILFRAIRGRSSEFVGVAVIVAVIPNPAFDSSSWAFERWTELEIGVPRLYINEASIKPGAVHVTTYC